MDRNLKRILAGLLCFALVLASGCTHTSRMIAVTVYPIQYLVERIAGSTVRVTCVQTDDTVQDATALSSFSTILDNSAVFIHMGNLEPYLSVQQDNIREHARDELDLSSSSALYEFARYDSEGNTSAYYDDESFAYVDVCEKEQAVWLDPIAMLSMGRSITADLKERYPEDADYYQANMDTLASELIDLDGEYQSFASSLSKEGETIRFVTMSNGFGIWQNAYGFEVYPVVLSRYGVLPDAKQLEVIKERIAADDVQYIVYEPNMSEEMKVLYNTLEEEMGLTGIELSNLSSLSEQQNEDGRDYMSIMKENLLVLETIEPNE